MLPELSMQNKTSIFGALAFEIRNESVFIIPDSGAPAGLGTGEAAGLE
jgi:hypothetical protein